MLINSASSPLVATEVAEDMDTLAIEQRKVWGAALPLTISVISSGVPHGRMIMSS
jgi:hypothetical protein